MKVFKAMVLLITNGFLLNICFFNLTSKGWKSREPMEARGPSVEELSPCLFPPRDYVPTYGIFSLASLDCFTPWLQLLYFQIKTQKVKQSQRPVSVGGREFRGTPPSPVD